MLFPLLEEEELECNASWELCQERSRGDPPPDQGRGSGLEAPSDFFTLYCRSSSGLVTYLMPGPCLALMNRDEVGLYGSFSLCRNKF